MVSSDRRQLVAIAIAALAIIAAMFAMHTASNQADQRRAQRIEASIDRLQRFVDARLIADPDATAQAPEWFRRFYAEAAAEAAAANRPIPSFEESLDALKRVAPTPVPPSAAAPPSAFDHIVYTTAHGEKYHASWCQHLRKSKIAIPLRDALRRGLEACSRCDP